MKKSLPILFLLTLFLGVQITCAQQNSDLKYRTLRVTLLPGLSTNGVEAPNYSAKYSLNILGGSHGALDGYEIGIVNINKYYAEGLQLGVLNGTVGHMAGLNMASLVNFAGDDMQGLQFGGLANISGGFVQGIQFSGLLNMGGGGLQGLQFAGIGNLAGSDIQGIQAAGIFNGGGDVQGIMMSGIGNFSGGSGQGILLSGVLNVANEMQGISMAGILNVGRTMQGIQLAGIANIADKAQGVQVGLVNLADEFEGVPVGLISLYGNGRRNVDLWVSDGGYTNVGLKLGTMDVYNMISLGYNSALNSSEELWSFGWSIGVHSPLEEAWNNDRYNGYFRMKDFTIQSIQEEGEDIWESTLYSYRYLLGKKISNRFGLYAGPTFNLMVTDNEDQRDYSWYSIFESNRWGKNFDFWVGFTAGVQLF